MPMGCHLLILLLSPHMKVVILLTEDSYTRIIPLHYSIKCLGLKVVTRSDSAGILMQCVPTRSTRENASSRSSHLLQELFTQRLVPLDVFFHWIFLPFFCLLETCSQARLKHISAQQRAV